MIFNAVNGFNDVNVNVNVKSIYKDSGREKDWRKLSPVVSPPKIVRNKYISHISIYHLSKDMFNLYMYSSFKRNKIKVIYKICIYNLT